LIAAFDLSRFGRAPARFDEAELARLNASILHRLPFERVSASLPAGIDAAGWEAIARTSRPSPRPPTGGPL
jgi:glutamyl-tRNA synthetase